MSKRIALFLVALATICHTLQAAPIWQYQQPNQSISDDYFLGTIHIGDKRLGGLSAQIKQIIDDVDVVALELDLSRLTAQQKNQISLKYGLLPAGKSLATELSPKIYQEAAAFLTQHGLNIEQMAQFKPWMLGLTMVQLTYAKQGLMPDNGIDLQIFQYAKQQGKRIIGLETMEQQLSFFDSIFAQNPSLTADDIIIDTLAELREHKHLPNRMIEAWLAGDLTAFKAIYKATLNESIFDIAAERILLAQRNKDWQQQLSLILPHNKTLVAVGTLHFVGDSSLVKLYSGALTPLK